MSFPLAGLNETSRQQFSTVLLLPLCVGGGGSCGGGTPTAEGPHKLSDLEAPGGGAHRCRAAEPGGITQ